MTKIYPQIAALTFVVGLMQWLMVAFGHPTALWLWCDMLSVCGVAQ